MLCFATDNKYFRQIGLWLLLLQTWLFILGMPPFQAGIWVQTELIQLFVFIFAAFTGLWIAIGISRQWLKSAGYHPFWVIMLLWVGWQLLATTFATSPWRSWFGQPQTGEGVGWHLAFLLMFMLAYILWQVPSYKRVLLKVTVLNLLSMCVLHWLYPMDEDGRFIPTSWSPMQWPAYLGFLAAYGWLAFASGRAVKKGGWYFLLIIFTFIVLLTSLNRSGIALLGAAITFSTFMIALRQRAWGRRFFYPGKRWKTLAVLACLFPFSIFFLTPEFSFFRNDDDHASMWKVFSERDWGMGSRLTLNQVSIATMKHEPERWLAGDGWGRYNDDLFKYILVDGVYAYHNGQRKPNSFLVDGNAFHSHSQPVEALLSLGLVGMILWFAMPVCLLWYMPRRYFWQCAPVLAGVVMLSHFWFQILQCLPYQAIAYAALANMFKTAPSVNNGRRKKLLLEGLLPFVSMAMVWGAWQQSTAIVYDTRILGASFSKPYPDTLGNWLEEDIKRGGDRFLTSAFFYVPQLSYRVNHYGMSADDIAWYTNFVKTARLMAGSERMGAQAIYLDLWLTYNTLAAFDHPSFGALRKEATASLEEAVLRVCRTAPLRYDLIATFLESLAPYTKHNVQEQIRILKEMLGVVPDHPGALWVLGHVLLGVDGQQATGKEMIQKAIALSVEEVYPIRQDELAKYR